MTYEIYNFGTPFLGHNYYILSLSDQSLRGRRHFFKRNNAFSLCDLYGHAQAPEPLPPGVMEFTILADPSLVIITTYLVCLIYAWE